ncbi:unnamed protein product [Echinostoma caproni]|uniref:Uncharacterized protein n=1 Tax=Echinostoma caproni TaxID=27848 RepID=A0A3P8IDA0_9TREM|nr:unnamed protein product [Echinostoma caproni]
MAARNTVHMERAPSGLVVKRSDADESADSKVAENAIVAAQLESDRLEALEREQCLHTRESLIKADLRGQRATKRLVSDMMMETHGACYDRGFASHLLTRNPLRNFSV